MLVQRGTVLLLLAAPVVSHSSCIRSTVTINNIDDSSVLLRSFQHRANVSLQHQLHCLQLRARH
jgi:hypothetical protein